MNPNYEQPGLSLPEPLADGQSPVAKSEQAPSIGNAEALPGQAGPAPSVIPSPTPMLNPALSASPAQITAPSTPASIPSLADDSDLIEKEWVTRAKAIIEQTKNDPREQSREMNYFKADYLKKRYNKDVKVSEG